jgi:phage baseplate assembly protein V
VVAGAAHHLTERLMGRLARRLRLLAARAVVKVVNDALKAQGLQVTLLAGEVADGVERVQEYGFTSVPEAGAEAVVLAIGGNRGHLVAVAVDDRRYRKKGLAAGEVALYTKFGSEVHLKADGSIVLKGAGGIVLDGLGLGLTKGVVQGDCICAFTGAPMPQTSVKVKGSL